ncbi:MAG: exodeoxyribonuclease VII large subunit, partial [Acidimicrobiales bacterium]
VGRLTGSARVRVRDASSSLGTAGRRLAARAPRAMAEAERSLAAVEARVRAHDPERALARGWSITRTDDGRVVRSADDVTAGDTLVTQLGRGEVRSTVDGDG